MRRWNKAALLSVTDDQRRTLEVWVRSRNTPQGAALRARIVLAVAEGVANKRIAQELGTTRTTVILWRERFKQGGVEALTQSEPGRGRRSVLPAQLIQPPGAAHALRGGVQPQGQKHL